MKDPAAPEVTPTKAAPPVASETAAFAKPRRLSRLQRGLVFAVAALFVYGGSVNYGAFGIFPATPFIVMALYAALRWGWGYRIATALLTVLCGTLFVLKHDHGPVFHPALGREIVAIGDVCLTAYREGFILASAPIKESCDASNIEGVRATEKMPKGTKLTISRVSVSNGEFAEDYVIHAIVPLGEISIYSARNQFAWVDGKAMDDTQERAGLWNPIFFYPSMLMYWPMAPMFLLTLFSKGS